MAQLAVSAVTEGELRFGAARLPHATRLHNLIEDFFLRVAVLPWGSDAAQQYGRLRATLERGGPADGNLDAMIAAHALRWTRVLVTNDHAFARISGHETRRLDERTAPMRKHEQPAHLKHLQDWVSPTIALLAMSGTGGSNLGFPAIRTLRERQGTACSTDPSQKARRERQTSVKGRAARAAV